MSALTDLTDQLEYLVSRVERREAERQDARDRAAEARQISDDPARWSIGPEPCAHPKDALGSCLGPCDGEGWDR